jgi:hypothetical protein
LIGLIAVPAAGQAGGEQSVAEAEVAFVYGLRAYHHGELDEALRLFREAVAADPGGGTYRYWLGLALLRGGDRAAAARELEASLGAPRPPAVERARVEADLARARGGAAPETAAAAVPGFLGEAVAPSRAPRRFAGRLGAAYGQDSNPVLLDKGVSAFFGGRTVAAEDADTVANLDARLELYPFTGRGGWTLGLLVEGQQSAYSDFDFLDARRLRGAAQLAWGSDPAGFLTGPLGYALVPVGSGRAALLLQGGLVETELDGEGYVSARQAAAALTFRGGRATATLIEVDLQDLDYDGGFAPDLERDGEQVTAKLSQILYLGRRERYLRLSVRGGERTAGAALEHRFFGAGAEAAWPLARRLTLQLAGSAREEDYDRPASNPRAGGAARSDTVLRADGVLLWQLAAGLRLSLRGSWTDRDSDYVAGVNDPPRDFSRTETAAGLTWSF